MTRLYLDTETYGTVSPRHAGAYRYAETARIILLSWAIDNGPVELVDIPRGEPLPKPLVEALADPSVPVWAHNATFDRLMLHSIMPPIPVERWRCSMALASLHGYPASLDGLGRALGLPSDKAKIKDGNRLIKIFCSPPDRDERSDPDDWALFRDYARQDISAMRECIRRLPRWNVSNEEYLLDQVINDRGIAVDTAFASDMETTVETTQLRILAEMTRMTHGGVKNGRSPAQCHRWVTSRGVVLPNFQKETLAALDFDDLPEDVAAFLTLRGMVARAASSKYSALKHVASDDSRARGALIFSGASRTRRWSGRHVQFQNLRSRGIPGRTEIETFASAVALGVTDLIYTDDETLDYAGAAVRRMVTAPEGRGLAVADLSNIESRVLTWLTGDPTLLAPFVAYDRKTGPDPYRVTAGDILGAAPADVTQRDRNIYGKTLTLAGGFGGGVMAYKKGLRMGGLDIEDIAEDTERRFPNEYEQAAENYEIWGYARNPDVPVESWIPLETLKLVWRSRNPVIVSFWSEIGDAMLSAMTLGGAHDAGRLRIAMQRHAGINYLRVLLPSGKSVLYCAPIVIKGSSFTYMAVDSQTKQWRRMVGYSGKIAQNATQSLARDVLAHGLALAEADGDALTPVLTVHDEVICECREGDHDAGNRLARHMETPPPWSHGLPLKAEGATMKRYGKD